MLHSVYNENSYLKRGIGFELTTRGTNRTRKIGISNMLFFFFHFAFFFLFFFFFCYILLHLQYIKL